MAKCAKKWRCKIEIKCITSGIGGGEASGGDEETPHGTTTLGSWVGMVVYHHPWRRDVNDGDAKMIAVLAMLSLAVMMVVLVVEWRRSVKNEEETPRGNTTLGGELGVAIWHHPWK